MLIADPFASMHRPVLSGQGGAVSAAHPLAVAAGQEMLTDGGSAVDALVAAQAVLCVLAPDACGLGGDALCLVRSADGVVTAVNGTGAAPLAMTQADNDGGNSVTVPGIVDAWVTMNGRWGKLPLERLLRPAVRLAREGIVIGAGLTAVFADHAARLAKGGAEAWPMAKAAAGTRVKQEALAGLLEAIGASGRAAFYDGAMADHIAAAAARTGGTLHGDDLRRHHTMVLPPLTTLWRGRTLHVQPPVSQGVLLSMALAGEERLGTLGTGRQDPAAQRDHIGVELTESSFAYRDRAGEGRALLDMPLPVDVDKASRKGGPRAYLHTAGVAVSDAAGMTVSSLVSVFDSFGSAVFVPEGGFTLNNRAAGFTAAPNDGAGGKRPIHTLAPMLIESADACVAMATPGADGQVQTLLQVLSAIFVEGVDIAAAIARPRWRSENSRLLVERSHPHLAGLEAFGHDVVPIDDGDLRFGAIVCAGIEGGRPFCCSDWRRDTWSGVV
ncbi:gamma-glutamyltransferase [Labrys monachus]|uniref:Gamma-glutamyltranspeptidase/glutathione hydrolase n=1 Tax=Labrys monachus TaxID=217067 RepID=A0ABU0F9A5_9HYPH|nr:gamma-glutamyltransferase [Labrys monachus]MDQ0390947.1 gamma-glutamyltranspeptidase/glutathione hydrolase [Labrys monachus]